MSVKFQNEVYSSYVRKGFIVEIAKRAYDDKYVVWRPVITFDRENGSPTFTLYWEIIGVHDTYAKAEENLKNYLEQRKKKFK